MKLSHYYFYHQYHECSSSYSIELVQVKANCSKSIGRVRSRGSFYIKSICKHFTEFNTGTDQQKAFRCDCNGRVIELIKGHYSEVVVHLYNSYWLKCK